jgi:hypothetical protein
MGSRPVVGSSKMTNCGSRVSARAMATRFRRPSPMAEGYWWGLALHVDQLELGGGGDRGVLAGHLEVFAERQHHVLEQGHRVEQR